MNRETLFALIPAVLIVVGILIANIIRWIKIMPYVQIQQVRFNLRSVLMALGDNEEFLPLEKASQEREYKRALPYIRRRFVLFERWLDKHDDPDSSLLDYRNALKPKIDALQDGELPTEDDVGDMISLCSSIMKRLEGLGLSD